MPDNDHRSLGARVTELEQSVRTLEAKLERLTAGRPAVPFAPRPKAAPRPPQVPEQLKDARYWFRVLGIGLLLLGTVFIFKYSEDEGRGIMTLRVAIGAAMGLGLVAIGHRLRHSERHFSSVLSGGGIGVWYITGFAAYQLFDLVGALPAFAFMTAVTVLAFLLSVRRDVVALAIVGALGGLGTPWLLYETDRALAGPVAYMCLVLAGTVAVYARTSWRALLWTSALAAGGAFVAIGARYFVDEGVAGNRVTLQVGVAFYWLLYAAVAMARELRSGAWAGAGESEAGEGPTRLVERGGLAVFVTLIPIYGATMTLAIWEPNFDIGGWVALAATVVYALAWWRLEASPGLVVFARAHLLAAVILVTMGINALLDGDVLIATLAAEAAALHVLARYVPGQVMPACAHLIYLGIGFVLLGRLAFQERTGPPVVNGDALVNLWVIVSGAAASLVMRTRPERFGYRYVAHGLILLWVLRELHDLPNGQGIVTIVWGVYAIALVVTGLRNDSAKLRVVGLVTLFATVIKLVGVDLSEVRAIWRVLLFSGFGVLLLGLSHWVRRFSQKPPG